MTADEIRRSSEARHAEVLGQPPRLAPLDRESIIDEVRAATDRIRGKVVPGSAPLPIEAIPEIMFTMVRVPELWQQLMEVTIQLQGPDSALDPRDRKLAILRTGWLCQAPYEFGEHVRLSGSVGLTSQDIERIIVGSSAPEWDDHERAILRAVEELHEDAMVSDATWATLARRMNERQLVELLVLVGQFTATAYFQNALRLRLEGHNAGLAAR